MKVGPDHWLEGVLREEVLGGGPMRVRRCLVVHFSSGATALSTINYWRSPEAKGASAHVIIDRDGTIYQCRPFNRTCGHAGVSRWQDPNTGHLYGTANAYGIGIELANAGHDEALARRWTKLQLIRAQHRNENKFRLWERFPDVQVAACTEIAKCLVERYDLDDVTGHDCIAPERKTDPGPALDMEALRIACGFTGLPVVHWP